MLHDTEKVPAPENPREAIELQSILLEFPWLKDAKLFQIGTAGWLVELPNVSNNLNAPVLSLDYDDFLVDSLGAKAKLIAQTTSYVAEQFVNAQPKAVVKIPETIDTLRQHFQSSAEKLVSLSDTFARWSHSPDLEKTYHSEAQVAALAWGLEQISTQLQSTATVEQALQHIENTLQQIGSKTSPAESTLDWYFMGNRLVTPTVPMTQLGVTQRLMKETLLKPEPQIGVVTGIIKLIKKYSLTPSILSSGVPSFQLLKIGEFFQHQPDFKPAFIGLANDDKGKFLLQARERFTQLSQPNSRLKMIHLDDLPKAVGTLAAVTSELIDVKLTVGRCKFASGKAAKLDWQPTDAMTQQFDFSQLPVTDPDFPNQFISQIATWMVETQQLSTL